MAEQSIWGIHGGRDDKAHKRFLDGNIAINYKELGDLANLQPTRVAFKAVIAESKQGLSAQELASRASAPFQFCHEMRVGDYVVYPAKTGDRVHFGQITGPYFYDSTPGVDFPHCRPTKWLKSSHRNNLSKAAHKVLGVRHAIFKITQCLDEFTFPPNEMIGNRDLDQEDLKRSVALIYAPELNPSTFLHFSWLTTESSEGAAIRDYFAYKMSPEDPDRSRTPQQVRRLVAQDIETGVELFQPQEGTRPNRFQKDDWKQRILTANEAHSATISHHLGLAGREDGTEEVKGYQEGAERYALHLVRERSRELVKDVKEFFKDQNGGRLFCIACGFDFARQYGKHGADFIEMHHTIPVSSLKAGDETLPKDCVLLCSNCHRMVHWRGGLIDPGDLRGMITTPWD